MMGAAAGAVAMMFLIGMNMSKQYRAGSVQEIFESEGVKDIESGIQWCFPGIQGNTLLYKLSEFWNNAHSDIFVVAGNDNFVGSVRKMALEYKKRFEDN